MNPAVIQAAFRRACADEVHALKPGNVHIHAAGHGMSVEDFLRSAAAAAPALCAQGAGLGGRVLEAVRATRAAVGQNTNLGILLLCAPLAMAAEAAGDLRSGVRRAIALAGVDEAGKLFEAIVLAAPGGLGEAPRHDVRQAATVPVLAAMTEAASRDRIAEQYANGFAEVFEGGMRAYANALDRWGDRLWAAVAAYLRHLASGPDSHVLRKSGPAEAERVRAEAVAVEQRFLACANPEDVIPELRAWDAQLKANRINPGTSADLTVATTLAYGLHSGLPFPGEDA